MASNKTHRVSLSRGKPTGYSARGTGGVFLEDESAAADTDFRVSPRQSRGVLHTNKQRSAAKKNIKKAQRKWRSMSHRAHALAQPEGRARKKPGLGGAGKFYHIEVRPKSEFVTFRNQDVGHKGGLERLAGKRRSGSWDTVTWLVGKDLAHVAENGQLIIDDPKARTMLGQIHGSIFHKKGDIFHTHPRNVPEKDKPTLAMRRAERANIKKAQAAWRKKKS